MNDRRMAPRATRQVEERRCRAERRRDQITADVAQFYVIYFAAFGKLPTASLLQGWEIAAIFGRRLGRSVFRGAAML